MKQNEPEKSGEFQVAIYQGKRRFSHAPFSGQKDSAQYNDGYRSATVNKVGSSFLNISEGKNLNYLVGSVHKDKTNSRLGITPCNLSLSQ